jgi:hypothetical protein
MDPQTEQEKQRIMRDLMDSIKQAKEQGDEAGQHYRQEAYNSLVSHNHGYSNLQDNDRDYD